MKRLESSAGLLLCALACSGEDITEMTHPDLDLPPDPEALAFKERFEAEHGPSKFDRYTEYSWTEDFGEPAAFDDEMPDPSEKANTPVVWGWAMKGVNVVQSAGVSTAHCVTHGRTCDGLIHSQLIDTYVDNHADIENDTLGRCGRFDGGADNAWEPCIVPLLTKARGGKAKTWRFNEDGCFDDAYGRSIFKQGIQLALGKLALGTGMSFTEVASNQDITFRCTPEAGSGTEALAFGVPAGDLRLLYAADHVFEEQCEEPGSLNTAGNYSYHFADMYYTYNKYLVGLNWNTTWSFINSCTSNQTAPKSAVANIVLHELGHAFGFQHQNFSDTRPAYAWLKSIMAGAMDCTNAIRSSADFHPYMKNALFDADMRTNHPLSIWDEDISCLAPIQ